jgi:hypothetical protein
LLCISFFSFCFVSGPFINQNIFLWFECSAFVSQTVYITIRCVFSNSENYKMSNRNNLSLLNIYFRIVTWIWIFCICVSPSPLVEEELSTLPEYLCSLSVSSGIRVARSLGFCVVFCGSLFVLCPLVIVFSVLLRFTTIILVSLDFSFHANQFLWKYIKLNV